MASGVLYRLDNDLRVSAFVELDTGRRGPSVAGEDANAATPVGLGEPFLSRVGCIQPGTLVRSVGELRSGASSNCPHFHRWSAAPPVAIDPARDTLAVPYSSGTSGLPKGVVRPARVELAIS